MSTGGVHVTELLLHTGADVIGVKLVNLGHTVVHGRAGVEDRFQLLVLHLDELKGLESRLERGVATGPDAVSLVERAPRLADGVC